MSHAKILTIPELVTLVESFGLPTVQRNFIWKPSQIEDLWDSLLRGYPIGSIITGTAKDGGELLLDGQQRATSIALGCVDLKESHEVLRSSTIDIRIFIDLRKPDIEKERRRYAFRVITRSHPWGYQRIDNKKPLNSGSKAKAIELWNAEDPFADGVLDKAYPYDAVAPFPLNIFTNAVINGASIEQVNVNLKEWLNRISANPNPYSMRNWLDRRKISNANENGGYETPETYSVDEIYEVIRKMMASHAIPMLPIPTDFIEENSAAPKGGALEENITDENNDDNELDELDDGDNHDDIEEVFVRLNSTGTPLGGEELNYSILKSQMNEGLKNLIEEKCAGVMKPARFISIAYVLYQNRGEESHSDDLRVKPRRFQREMREKGDEFQEFIREELLKKEILEKVKTALKYGERGINEYSESVADYRLPYPLFIRVAAASRGEIMLVLMYRLWKKRDVFKYDSPSHRQMVGIILMFMWLGKNHDKLTGKIWKVVKTLPCDVMWSNVIIEMAQGDNELKKIPKDGRFFDPLSDKGGKLQTNTDIRKRFDKSAFADFADFRVNVMQKRELLFWTQRKFIATSGFFKESFFHLEDSNVPFDWDHISANNFIKNIKKQDRAKPLSDIYQMPGNFRVWPFQLNRFDSDHVPAKKFNIDLMTENAKTFLKKGAFRDLCDSAEINMRLLDASFCEKEWVRFEEEGWLGHNGKILKDRWHDIYALIFNRWKRMYEEINKELRLSELAKKPKALDIYCVLNKSEWATSKSWKIRGEDEEYKQHMIELGDGLYFYIEEWKEYPGDIQFGFMEKENKDSGNSLKEEYSDGEDYIYYDEDRYRYIFINTSLSCLFAKESYESLLKEIVVWLQGYKCSEHKNAVFEKIPEIRKYMKHSPGAVDQNSKADEDELHK